MAKVKITGHASGSGVFTITAPNSNTDRTITLPDASVTLGTDATKLPLAGGSMTGDIGMGANDISLNDNGKLKVGSHNDLNIYHDGSNSYIEENTGTGSLILSTNGTGVDVKSNGGENIAKFIKDGAVELYHNNVKKLETTAAGGTLTGYWTGATKVFHVNATRNMTTASGTQAITGVGFTPLAVVVNAVVEGSHAISWGSQAAANKGTNADYSTGGSGANLYTSSGNSYCINLVAQSAGNSQKAVVSSWDSDGATLTWTKADSPTGTAYIRLLFIG